MGMACSLGVLRESSADRYAHRTRAKVDSRGRKGVIQLTTKIGRDAGNGKFIPVKQATANPKTAVVETLKRPAGASPPAKKGK